MEFVHNYVFVDGYYNYGEIAYLKIAELVGKNYLLLRTVVWGGAFALFCWTAKRLNVPVYYAVIFLFATHTIIFAYARATAAMAVYFCGLSFIIKPLNDKKWSCYLVGIVTICCSFAFHNTALVMIAMTVIVLIPLRNKWIILIIASLVLFFANLVQDYLFLFAEGTSNELLAKKISSYSERELDQGIASKIISLFEYLSFYLPFFLSSLCIFKKNNELNISSAIYNLYKVTFGIILLATAFYFLGDSFVTFFYRILFMTMIPISLIVVKLYDQDLMSLKYFRLCYMPGLIFLILRYSYDCYLFYIK